MIIFFGDFPSSALDRGHTNIEVELFDVISDFCQGLMGGLAQRLRVSIPKDDAVSGDRGILLGRLRETHWAGL
jgi:hypothetical protein